MMKKFLPLLSFVLLALSYSGKSQKYSFAEIKADSLKHNFKKILIVSVGPKEPRAFSENLSEQLIKRLIAYSVQAEFNYLGKDTVEGKKKFILLDLQNYDAVITLMPADSVYFTTRTTTDNGTFDSRLGAPQFKTSSRFVFYAQTFNIQLFEPIQQDKIIWSTFLSVFFDPIKSKIYKDIAKVMISSFRKSNIIK